MAGIMIKGKWVNHRKDQDEKGQMNLIPTTFRDRITADGSSGFKAEAGRYHLYVALPCPWAHRTLIMRELKGLNEAISVTIVDPILSDRSWKFLEVDPVNHAHYLQEIYLKADPNYSGRVTVPVLWDRQTQTIINDESLEIMRMFDIEFADFATQSIDLYPSRQQEEIEAAIAAIHHSINIGVYRAGFATSQTAYETAITEVFEGLDHWETVLSQQRYLCGDQLTEADVCFFVTLFRFDSVYYTLFKCNLKRILDYPNLWNYLKDLYQRPEFKRTCDLDGTKRSYFTSMVEINPNQIVPKGLMLNLDEPSDRTSKFQ